ncbi:MAG: quinoprotein glucose dehydrogenase, partial [Pseudoalteromonas tetraodonis]
ATVVKSSADQAQTGNHATNAFDADPETRWAASGHGRWIQFELDRTIELSELRIGFHHGQRDYAFDIRLSNDGKAWSPPKKFQSSGNPDVIAYQFPKQKLRFGRITVYGSDDSDWANIHTIHIPGVSAATPPKSPPVKTSGFEVTEWASDSAIKNSVAISIDDRGRAYLTVVERRKQSSLDIRNHQDLVKKDLSLLTVEDRRLWYKGHLTGQNWLPDRNSDGTRDWRDLMVQRDKVLQLGDTDGDGKAEAIRIMKEYHSEVTGIVAGVLAVGDDVFVAAEPDFLRYSDEDGDGFPETQQLVATGMQVHMGQGGHNLSGVAVGPDGRVYWSLADKGHFVETQEGKTYHMPNAGAIFRCELDGTNVERYSTGERNAQELAFDAHGNLFSMDNDGDYPGEKERALYITEGSKIGWRLNWQWLRKQDFTKISGIDAYNPWMEEKLFLPHHEGQAAYITPTIGNFGPGPCGFVANPGTALSADLADCFFMTNQKGEVRVFRFQEKGASFSFSEAQPIKGGLNNTGLAIGPDGALYSASYGSNNGAIFRFDVAEENQHPARTETKKILALDASDIDAKKLQGWLDHPDQRVRMKGQFELARRGAGGAGHLRLALTDANTRLGKLHAMWGIGQLARKQPVALDSLMPAWDSSDPEILAQAAKVTGETKGGPANLQAMHAGLDHPSPRVRFFCAIAIGNRGYREAAADLVKMLEENADTDPYLRHAAVMGLRGTMTPDELATLNQHDSRSVRLGAIVALRRLGSPMVAAFLADEDELVLLEAARAIHDDSIDGEEKICEALPDLSALLTREKLKNEALLRRSINAALRNGSGTDLQNLVAFLKRGHENSNLRRTALAAILWWSNPPVLDAVEGRYRQHAPRDAELANRAVIELRDSIAADIDLREVLLNGVAVRGEAQWFEGIDDWPTSTHTRLLSAMAKVESLGLKPFVEQCLQSEDAAVREKAREYAAQVGIPLVDQLIAILDDPKPAGQGKAIAQLAKLDDPRAQKKFAKLIERYRAGDIEPEWKLELWQAAELKGIELPATTDRLEFGGNAKRGKKLVMQHAAAQCIRCHQLGKDGSNLGPDLSKIGKIRTRAQLVTSMLDPTSEISDGYGTILLKTKSGEEHSGVLSKQTDQAWTITLPDGKEKSLSPNDIESHTLTSVMPPMGALMKPHEIRDIIAYLAGLN